VILDLTRTVAGYYLRFVAEETPVELFLMLTGVLVTGFVAAFGLLLGTGVAARVQLGERLSGALALAGLGAVQSAHCDLVAQRKRGHELQAVAAPEPARVIPARRSVPREQPHVLVGSRDQLGAVDRLELRCPADPAFQPLPCKSERCGERTAVVAVDDLHQAVLVVALDLAAELTDPGSLVVSLIPRRDCVAEVMQLNAALSPPRPHIRQRAPELGMPQQRRQIVDRDHHADVVHRAVGERSDRKIRGRPSPEQPDVASRGRFDRAVKCQRDVIHGH
jgi:hypothetical protein